MPIKYHSGHMFGSWKFLGKRQPYGYSQKFLCECKCGRQDWVIASNLQSGLSTQCRPCCLDRRRKQSEATQYMAGVRLLRNRVNQDADPRWKTLDSFLSDYPELSDGTVLYPRKFDSNAPYSKDNLYFSSTIQRCVHKDVVRSGNICLSMAEWGQLCGLTRERIRQLVNRGLTGDDLRNRYQLGSDEEIREKLKQLFPITKGERQ